MSGQERAPFLEAVAAYVEAEVLGFNIPGHHQGRAAPEPLRRLLGQALRADLTQVLGMDDLHRPLGVTRAAQELAAQAWGADQTWFLINGSTSGNQAMLLGALQPGELVLVPRNAHRSVAASLVLADARPLWYLPPYDPEMGVFHCPEPAALERLLNQHPEARALLVTSPTYHGAVGDLEGLVRLTRSRGVLLLVDEAWGPHLGFHPELPLSAVRAGADLVVHGSHKLLAALSQAAMLHRVGDRVDSRRLESAVQMLLSTSPSTLLVASLDAARQQLASQGADLLQGLLERARQARAGLRKCPGVRVYGEELVGRPGVHALDPTRVVFSVAGYSGTEIERILREDAGLQVEMADSRLAVALLTMGHTATEVEALVQAVGALPRRPPGAPRRAPQAGLPPCVLSPRQAFYAPREAVPLERSLGRISAETVGVYPPGIPLVCAGEEITSEVLTELLAERAAGASLQGGHDPDLRVIHVVTAA